MLASHFKVKVDQHFVQRVLRSRLITTSNLQTDIKLESSEAYLLKLGKNLSWDLEGIYIFRKNKV